MLFEESEGEDRLDYRGADTGDRVRRFSDYGARHRRRPSGAGNDNEIAAEEQDVVTGGRTHRNERRRPPETANLLPTDGHRCQGRT